MNRRRNFYRWEPWMGWSIATGVCCLVAAYGMTKSDTAIWLPAILAGGVSLSFLLWG